MRKYTRKSYEERVKEIQFAALELFLDKGFSKTTMDDVIAATSMSKGGVYHYYKNTYDILADLIRLKNYNYLRKEVDLDACHTPEEACDILAKAFVERMTNPSSQSRLHLMMAYEFANNHDFLELYYEIEKEPLEYIKGILKKFSDFESEKSQKRLMLLYRINNTMHFVRTLYIDKESWGVDNEMLYELYYRMFWDIISDK